MCLFKLNRYVKSRKLILMLAISSLIVSCGENPKLNEINSLNDKAYHFHYISLDSTLLYANCALEKSTNYDNGRNEALNNLAFVDIIKMDYVKAEKRLKDIISYTDNNIELLVADIQMMRLCQRQSRNKEFYDYYWKATLNLKRINEERNNLSERQKVRVCYAETEMNIVLSAYLYYVGQIESSIAALNSIDVNGDIQKDTAQLLNYFYNIGSGEYFTTGTQIERSQKEFDYLIRCYYIAERGKYTFWQGNALQAMSEHFIDESARKNIKEKYYPAIKALNLDEINNSLWAGNLAQRSLSAFSNYGDVYQISGALRSLSNCYFQIGDYKSAISCLNEAIEKNSLINQAPALKSSIYEKLSINYSALNEKQNSDYYRNRYLDTQENTRQDRELEARAEQLDKVSLQLNLMIIGVFASITMLIILLFIFTKKRKDKESGYTSESFLDPLKKWKISEMQLTEEIAKRHEVILEKQRFAEFSLEQNLYKNLEQRAKMSLVNSITPFIDRMLVEIHRLQTRNENEKITKERFNYILELTDKINEYNSVLTNWIELRKGELNLHIESFKLQEIFDIISGGKTSFVLNNINLQVVETKAIVKADKTLTLFMINTIADNARKATRNNGLVRIFATETDEFVEVSISDNGDGMDDIQLKNVFNHQPSSQVQHGFGLMNCKGIIEKYKKISKLFSVCDISAFSEKGKGSIFKFRLPYGMLRTLVGIIFSLTSLVVSANNPSAELKFKMYADSAYFSNLQGRYKNTLEFAKLTCLYLNKKYKEILPEGKDTIKMFDTSVDKAAETKWFADSLPISYDVILDIRNEAAVAALALHDWEMYNYNNSIYTKLFRESSADHSLAEYVKQTQVIRDTKNVAIILLIIIFVSIMPAYYMLYYRHKVYYQSLIEVVKKINLVLFEDISEDKKLQKINNLWQKSKNMKYVVTKETSALNDVVVKICDALIKIKQIKQQDKYEIEIAEDELKRLNYETQHLYINNNVLDNCFSTLKHETMYYPSRIRQIIEANNNNNYDSLSEITQYYKDLYSILSMQAQSQLEGTIRINNRLLMYLESLLMKLSVNETPRVRKESLNNFYNSYTIEYRDLILNKEQTINLFTPLTTNLLCLIIKQIVREIGETSNRRGSGVQAKLREDNGIDIVITLSNKIDLNLNNLEK